MSRSVDMAIVGGGLAGLSLAILSARAGHSVMVFEKERYPFHRVCGEYVSMEAIAFLERIGIPLTSAGFPRIKQLVVSAPSGKILRSPLEPGGIGISRHLLGQMMARAAVDRGVELIEGTRVNQIFFDETRDCFQLEEFDTSAKIVAACSGKRSNLDLKWKRKFLSRKGKLQNWVGIKYHASLPWDSETIALHNFSGGYCGVSMIENGLCCVCYLTTSDNLRNSGNSIEEMEQCILGMNPHLKEIFSVMKKQEGFPLTISQISFSRKEQVLDHVLLTGDAAGMITPLCGNGMSMAMQGAVIAAAEADRYLNGNCSRQEMEHRYQAKWRAAFNSRLQTGRALQGFFGNPRLSNVLVQSLLPFPGLTRSLIALTHGKPF